MSQITAIIADTSSVGYARGLMDVGGDYTSAKSRRNTQNAVARIRTVMNPHVVQEVPGGMISADFTIPAEEAQRWRPMLRYGAYCWLFDGQTPIFMGQLLDQPTWTPAGDAQVVVSGPWVMLGSSRMRDVWELRDLAVWSQSPATNERRDASTQVRGDGSLLMSFLQGSSVNSGQFAAVEYVLPGSSGSGVTLDLPVITGFEVHISDAAFNGNANVVFRVQAIGIYGDTGTNLYNTTSTGSSLRQTADNVFGENTIGTFTAPRGLRMGIFATANITAGGGVYVVVDRMRITTRQTIFPTSASSHDTAAIARDIFLPRRFPGGGVPSLRAPEQFWPSSSSIATTTYDAQIPYGRDALTGSGTAPDSGVGVTGFNVLDMVSPSEILLQLAGIDGYHVGFYLPYNQRGGYDTGNANDAGVSLWLSARPQLYYQAWPDPKTSPDYTVQIREGAAIQDDDQRQKMLNVAYANYQTNRGLQLTSDAVDGDPGFVGAASTNSLNYLTNQGFRAVEDWSIDASVNTDTADSLTRQMLAVRRVASAASTVTITNDGTARFPILKNGAQIPHLSQIRPGSVRIVDIPSAGGLRQGYATRVEWWGATLDQPERVELTMSDPGQMMLERRIAWAALRANRQRVSGG